jgi:histidine triad (HIT) family protein
MIEKNKENKKEDCVFCKIISGKIPSYKIYENKKVLVFLDINPYAFGHTLVIPKEHSDWLWDMDRKEYASLMKEVHYIANTLRKTFETNWIEGVVAGMGVSHTHVHLMPRKKEDGLGELPIKPLIPKPSEKEMVEISNKIKNFL